MLQNCSNVIKLKTSTVINRNVMVYGRLPYPNNTVIVLFAIMITLWCFTLWCQKQLICGRSVVVQIWCCGGNVACLLAETPLC